MGQPEVLPAAHLIGEAGETAALSFPGLGWELGQMVRAQDVELLSGKGPALQPSP